MGSLPRSSKAACYLTRSSLRLLLFVVEIRRQRAVRVVVLHEALMERLRLSGIERAEVRVRRISRGRLRQMGRQTRIPVWREAERIRVRCRRRRRRGLRVSLESCKYQS